MPSADWAALGDPEVAQPIGTHTTFHPVGIEHWSEAIIEAVGRRRVREHDLPASELTTPEFNLTDNYPCG